MVTGEPEIGERRIEEVEGTAAVLRIRRVAELAFERLEQEVRARPVPTLAIPDPARSTINCVRIAVATGPSGVCVTARVARV